MWKFEPNPGGGKPRKVPYYATGGRRVGQQGSPDDVKQLVPFAQAKAAAIRRGMNGVGFATLREFGITALDFDNCVLDGQLHPDLTSVVGNSYSETSPSGNGVRCFFQGDLGDHKAHGEPYGFETFSGKGYVTLTGNTLDITNMLGNEDLVAPIPPMVMDLVRARFKREPAQIDAGEVNADALGLTPAKIDQILSKLPDDLDYDQWLSVGMAVHHETGGAGFELWDALSQRSSKYTTREYGLERWASFGKNQGSTVTMRSVIKMAGIGYSQVASAEDFEVVTEETIQAYEEALPMRFPLVPIGQFASRPAPTWLIDDVLPKAELVVVYGASGSGKSFVALDMAFALARGVPWHGHRSKRTRCVYVAAEGAAGLGKRAQAYAKHYQVDLKDMQIQMIETAPNLMLIADSKEITRSVGSWGDVGVVIIDTLAQVTPGGNENAGEDMGKVLAHCKKIRERTGAMIVLIHHAGKDQSKGARGWSGLKAAADAEIEVVRNPAGDRLMRVTKQKDGEDGLKWPFRLQGVPLGLDDQQRPVSSCVVVDGAMSFASDLPEPVSEKAKTVLRVAKELVAKSNAVTREQIIDAAVPELPKPADGARDQRKRDVKRAFDSLIESNHLSVVGEQVCVE